MEFKTLEEAEQYYWSSIARHNEDEAGLEIWLEDNVTIKENELK